MKLTAEDLYDQGIVEQVLPEPPEYTMENMGEVTELLESRIQGFLGKYGRMEAEMLAQHRYGRFRSF